MDRRILLISTLGAQSNLWHQGFRQKDVRFIAELFSNWMDSLLLPDLPQWHNTQFMRFLNEAEKKAWAKMTQQRGVKRYHLTRLGILELIYELIDLKDYAEIRPVLLVYYFLYSYKARMVALIQQKGSGFSKALQMEIEHLLDHQRFIERQIESLERQIARMKIRVEETNQATKLAEQLSRRGEKVSAIIDQVAQLYPYELEVQRPMAELFKEIEPTHQLWELTQGNRFRSQVLWTSQQRILESNLKILQALSQNR